MATKNAEDFTEILENKKRIARMMEDGLDNVLNEFTKEDLWFLSNKVGLRGKTEGFLRGVLKKHLSKIENLGFDSSDSKVSTVKIPDDYNYETFLFEWVIKAKTQIRGVMFPYYPEDFLNNKHRESTDVLKPGKEYNVSTLRLKEGTCHEDCAYILKKKKGLFVGIHGLMLLYSKNSRLFPIEEKVLCIGNKESIGELYPKNPFNEESRSKVETRSFSREWKAPTNPKYYLLLVTEK